MKTIRFSQVVAQSGQPEPYTLWSAPEKDQDFQAALKQQRVMTVHQETVGAKKDYGEVGFSGDHQSTLLIFPKSLKAFAEQRVIGVKYDLLAPAPEVKTRSPKAAKTAAPKAAEKALPKPPALKPLEEAPKPAAVPFGPLRVFRAEEAARPKVNPPAKVPAERREPTPKAPVHEPDSEALERLTREVQRAMKQLQSGKAVAAYQTLEKALQKSV
ncbi:MAG TPA: hypothetical protein VGO90_05885 [Chthoniobacteraceae bacterium]|jgi:hypothetical protein|nr:hypothetical protein [Chthoniobacteraceae bacterium]